jgi:hypothetical protein
MNRWGLAADEFTDNGHWPHQIYVREARRMVGDFVVSELHLRGIKASPRPVGMGSYNMDSHNVQRYVDARGHVRNEGDIQINPGGPYPIDFGALLPKKSECGNLLVPVCVSSSHIAYGSVRMEPVFMILAQSAATAASLAIEHGVAVQDVDYRLLKERLLADGQVLNYDGPKRKGGAGRALDAGALAGIVVDDSQAKLTGRWAPSIATGRFLGSGYLHDGNVEKGDKSALFKITVPAEGLYEIRLAYTAHPNRAEQVPVRITSKEGSCTVFVNQRDPPAIQDAFVVLGRYVLSAQHPATVQVSNERTDGFVIVDAVQAVSVPRNP